MIQLESRQKTGWCFLQIQGKLEGAPIAGPPFPYYSHKDPLKYGNGMGSLWAFPAFPLVMFVSVNLHQAKRYFDPTTEPDGAE